MHGCQDYTLQANEGQNKANQSANKSVFLHSLSLSFSHTFALSIRCRGLISNPPTLPPPWCVCSVAISKSISCHFSFLLTQSYSLHLVQGDEARSVVRPNKFSLFFVKYSLSTFSTWCIQLHEVQLCGMMAIDGEALYDHSDDSQLVTASSHSGRGYDISTKVTPSLIQLHNQRRGTRRITPMCEMPGLCPTCHQYFRNKLHKLFMNILRHRFSTLRAWPHMGFPQLQKISYQPLFIM